MDKVRIVYYTGTGGTRMAAECLAGLLKERNYHVMTQQLKAGEPEVLGDFDRLIVMFPVYAFNAPEPVLSWTRNMSEQRNKRAAVISVSGGGEMCPNTACRRRTIKNLQNKGFQVDYESMLVMPPNIAIAIKPPLDKMLLDILPEKVGTIADELQQNITRRKKSLMLDRTLAPMSVFERFGAHLFGRRIRVSPACNGCARCATNCPSGNIFMLEGRPVFGKVCHLCMNCMYSCPERALSPGLAKMAMLKEGYDLETLARMPKPDPLSQEQIEALAPGFAWMGVRAYLASDR